MIDHELKFVFIHISKTGGTSIERAFQPSLPLCLRSPAAYKNTDFDSKHRTAGWYRNTYAEAFNTYFKFAFVRNPWDRMVSNYNWAVKAEHWPTYSTSGTFEEWLLRAGPLTDYHYSYRHMLCVGEQLLVNFVGRFEQLQSDFDVVCDQLGTSRRTLPHHNNLSNRPHYSTYYTKTTEQLVRDRFKWAIVKFDYEFERC